VKYGRHGGNERRIIKMELPNEVFIENLIFLAYRGSVAHNMYIPNTDPYSIDDIDLMGVFIGPENYYIGLKKIKTTIEKKIEKNGILYDCVYYEIRHFVRLLLKGNPNVLSMLWLEPEHYLLMSSYFKKLLEYREAFNSKQVYYSFTGYAHDQLYKMENYSNKGYMGEKRKRLVEKFGYDTKNAAHLIRLLMMGIEFLHEGRLNVARYDDADILLDIKRGKWSLDEIKDTANIMFNLALMAKNNSKLPDSSNESKAEELVMAIIYDYILLEQSEI